MKSGLGMLRYYSADHEGAVRLRVNSGSTTVKYAVTGQWDPNGIVFCPWFIVCNNWRESIFDKYSFSPVITFNEKHGSLSKRILNFWVMGFVKYLRIKFSFL